MMNDRKILYHVRPDVSDYIQVCSRLLRASSDSSLTLHERELIVLYTRKLIEKFL
jgi:hypothetical protein